MLTHTVQITRKVSDGNYGSTEYGIFQQFNGDFEAGVDAAFDAAQKALDARINDVQDQGIQNVIDAFPGASVEPADQAEPIGMMPATPPFDPETKDKDQKRANQDWAIQRFQRAPKEFYDNRPDKASGKIANPRYPDIKHKDSGVAAWMS